MKDLKFNLQFNYLYRDGGNYKRFGSIIFSNPTNLSVAELEDILRKRLIDEAYFYHEKLDVPPLFFNEIKADDPSWHEYESMERTDQNNSDKRTIEEFLMIGIYL